MHLILFLSEKPECRCDETKKTYAATSPRMIVRFFGGWDFTAQDPQDSPPAEVMTL